MARIALAARHVAYGGDLVYSGPIYDSMTVEGNKIRIKFKNIGGGLTLGTPPPTATGKKFSTPTELTGFGIAGADQKFAWAKVILDRNTVIISSDEIQQPVAVRYDWGQNPPAIFITRKDCQPLPSERMTGRRKPVDNSGTYSLGNVKKRKIVIAFPAGKTGWNWLG